jgi:hypothetical protein
MTGDNLFDAVFCAIIAGMVILRVAHRTKHVFKLNHWEFVLILCCFAVYRVLRHWGWHSAFYAWLASFVCVIVGVYSYFRRRPGNFTGMGGINTSRFGGIALAVTVAVLAVLLFLWKPFQ